MPIEPELQAQAQMAEKGNPNEIRVSSRGAISKYIRFAIFRLAKDLKQEALVVRGTGAAVPRVLTVVEIIKQRVGFLHQITNVYSIELENKQKSEELRRVTVLEVTLSKGKLDASDPGYQKPAPPGPRLRHNSSRRQERGGGGFNNRSGGGFNERSVRRTPRSRLDYYEGPPPLRTPRRPYLEFDRPQRWEGRRNASFGRGEGGNNWRRDDYGGRRTPYGEGYSSDFQRERRRRISDRYPAGREVPPFRRPGPRNDFDRGERAERGPVRRREWQGGERGGNQRFRSMERQPRGGERRRQRPFF